MRRVLRFSPPLGLRAGRQLLVLAWLLWLWVLPAQAALPEGFAQYQQTAWTTASGAPADIWAMRQSRDGYLWLATGFGLYRFDGQRFERRAPPPGTQFASNNMTALEVEDDGTLWIGYYNAGVTRVGPKTLDNYGQAQGVPGGMVFGFARDADHRLWVATDHGLAYFNGQRWIAVGAAEGFVSGGAQWLLQDRHGRLWVATAQRLYYLPAHGKRFVTTEVTTADLPVMAESPDGRLWLADPDHGVRAITDASGQLLSAGEIHPLQPRLKARRMMFARDGSLWGTDYDERGIFRIGAAALAAQRADVERLGRADGLTADMAGAIVQDREGSFWIGTNLGLNRLRHRNVMTIDGLVPKVWSRASVLADAQGNTLLINHGVAVSGNRSDLQKAMEGTLPLLPSPKTNVWWAGDGGVWQFKDGVSRVIAPPEGSEIRQQTAMAVDREGQFWLSVDQLGVFVTHDGHWRRERLLPTQGATAIVHDRQGRTWLGYPSSTLRVLEGGKVRTYDRRDGLDVGHITALLVDGGQPLIAGEMGIATMTPDGRFHTLPPERSNLLTGITGIAEDRHGELWLNGNMGVVRINRKALTETLWPGTPSVPAELFNALDGLPGIAEQASMLPTALAAADGLLWFSTNQGLAWIDPDAMQRNLLPPQVFIRGLRGNDVSIPLSEQPALERGVTRVQITYTATSLAESDRLNFRYRLKGVDEDWRDAGSRREAFYTNLAPGDYLFEVSAANNDGIWSLAPATLRFTIAPALYQTLWFQVLGAVIVLLGIWMLMRWRAHLLFLRLKARLQERHGERERIARELHDTLLQGMQGLILRLHAMTLGMADTNPVRHQLEKAMDLAEHALGEARDRVRGLRNTNQDADLAEALMQIRDEYPQSNEVTLTAVVEGRHTPLKPLVHDELLQLGREALANAFRHAQAQEIEIQLCYGLREFRLYVRDDGRGISEEVLDRQGVEGHWGLPGMHERAKRICAQLQIWSRPGAGTELQLRMPARLAYRDPLWQLGLQRLRLHFAGATP
ncbi:Signal transduction histidine kinase [Pseudoxanthomonas sp. GM95]|uniref:sensor histidine kinase n=1 Tax=Pseudoxanthomonas sp. GM95 TaxID=1881043 RepID=UPI0008CA1114|nr:sensor histidine kinase [Pseudoxanthomonas sp. GM95]SEL10047.1 Signal transduction histidine kinase [Pseudoxanthomonas sp. GM95]